jgi:hypothetical protein
MVGFFATIINYVWVFIKLFILCAVLSIPILGLVYFFKNFFKKLNKKYSFVLSLYIIIFILNYIVLLLLYFIPAISKLVAEYNFLDGLLFVLFHIARLILINALFSGILLIIGMFISLLYDSNKPKTKKKKAKEEISFLNLWKSITIVLVVVISFILVIFPKLPVIIFYLLYM